jgi:hypothetical protein
MKNQLKLTAMNAVTENNYLADDNEYTDELMTPKSGCGVFLLVCLLVAVLIISGLVKIFK